MRVADGRRRGTHVGTALSVAQHDWRVADSTSSGKRRLEPTGHNGRGSNAVKRMVLVLVALAVVLSSLGGAAIGAAKENGRRGRTPSAETSVRPVKRDLRAPRPPRPADVGQVEVQRDGTLVPAEGRMAAAAATPQWIDGPFSNTTYFNVITGTTGILTNEWVGYWGTTDVSYPKTGELYYGRVVMANVGTQNTAVTPNIVLPRGTFFDINPNDPSRKVRCYVWNFTTDATAEFGDADCDQQPSPGPFGAQFAPSGSVHNGVWHVPPGWAIVVVFPIFSKAELSGLASGQAACMIGSVFAAGSNEVWDAPGPGDTCPVPSGRGAYQGVFVAFNPPTIAYPSPAATNVTATTARLHATLRTYYDPGTVFFDLGPTPAYGQVDSGPINDSSHTFQLTSDWSGLQPGTTYHWRVRFRDSQGRIFLGPDQTLTTGGSADNASPRVTRMKPGTSAARVSRTANVRAVLSEPVQAATVNAATVRIFKSGSNKALAATVTYNAGTRTATLNPKAKLRRGATYKVVVATGVRDVAGNPLDQDPTKAGNQPKIWTFRVKP